MKPALAVVSLFFVIAAPARAATAEVVEGGGPMTPQAVAFFRGEGDEVNEVLYSEERGGKAAVFRDSAAVVRAGAGCSAIDEHTVRCTSDVLPVRGPQRLPVVVELGDGADGATAQDVDAFVVRGGAGNDQLSSGYARQSVIDGGDGDDRLIGGNGDDQLVGGLGADVLSAGLGSDELIGDPATGPFSPDQLHGGFGLGVDTVSYAERTVRVFVDAAAGGPDGAAGEGDVVEGVENIVGGLANDVLVGDAFPNRLDGGGGSDVLGGRGGDDLLIGSEGIDRIEGDEGNDTVEGAGGADLVIGGAGDDVLGLGGVSSDPGDQARCGDGEDRVRSVDVRDLVRRDCEGTEVLGIVVGVPRESAVRLTPTAAPVPCRVVVTLTTRRRARRSRAVRVRSTAVRVAVRRRARVRRRPAADRLRVELRGVGCGGVGGFVLAP
jgi:hypothetical protein